MAYLLTDAAAGSTAMRQMQQNYLGSQYDAQNAEAAAQQKQLEVQQAQQSVKAGEISNALSEAKLERDKQTKDAVTTFMKKVDPKTPLSDIYDGLARTLAEAGNVEAAEKLSGISANAAMKEAKAQQIQSDLTARRLQVLESRVNSTPLDRIMDLFDTMPDSMKKALEKDVPGIMTENNPERLKAMLHAASQTAQGHNLADQHYYREQQELLRYERQKEIKELSAKLALAGRVGGGGVSSNKDAVDAGRVNNQLIRLDHEYKKPLADSKAKVEELYQKAKSSSWSSVMNATGRKSSAVEDYEAAHEDYVGIQKELVKKQLDLVDSYPDSPSKTKIFKNLLSIQDSLDVAKPKNPFAKPSVEEKAAANPELGASGPIGNLPDSGKKAYKATKVASTDMKNKVEATGQQYDPDKYDYRVLPNGSVQRKLKGQ